jgi:hypothetical protein
MASIRILKRIHRIIPRRLFVPLVFLGGHPKPAMYGHLKTGHMMAA